MSSAVAATTIPCYQGGQGFMMELPFPRGSTVITCTSCGRENEDEFKFCLGCGAALPRPVAATPVPVEQPPAMVDCTQCGTAVPSHFKFCGSCGAAIQRVPAAQPAPAPVPVPAAEPPREEAPVKRLLGKLTVIRPDGTEGATIDLHGEEVRLGRDSEVEALASDPFLSPLHASITYEQGQFHVHDRGSLNGVFIRVRDEVEIMDGDEIRIGQELLRFEVMKPAAVKAASPKKARKGGSPDSGAWARLSLVAGPEQTSRAFVCATDEVTIGREIGAILFRDDGFVSGKHARIVRQGDRYALRDLNSSNGTYLRMRNESLPISRGELILMGQQLFRLHT
jgi:pSer/pThr/pTyr-binding forkhead associated (FHA) protein